MAATYKPTPDNQAATLLSYTSGCAKTGNLHFTLMDIIESLRVLNHPDKECQTWMIADFAALLENNPGLGRRPLWQVHKLAMENHVKFQ